MNIDAIVEQAIRDAIAAGKFDNLAGQGKPLDLRDNPYEPESWRTAFHLLAANDFVPPWMEEGQDIEREFQAQVDRLSEIWQAKPSDARWRSARVAFEEALAKLNRRILNYNLITPADAFKRAPYDPATVIARITSAN